MSSEKIELYTELHRIQDRINALKIREYMEEELLDEDGYPTFAALNIIELWPWTDPKGWFSFIEKLWNFHEFGWHEKDEPHDYKEGELVHRYYISTAGWSGNEEIIRSMEKNTWMWSTQWAQSRRGGHYIFELKEYEWS